MSLFAVLGDVLKPKSFAGLFGAAPSVALATLGLTIVADGKRFATQEAHSMIAGALALFLYACVIIHLIMNHRWHAGAAAFSAQAVWLIFAIAAWAVVFAIERMRVSAHFSALKETKWYEFAVRFFFGGAITVITGLLAKHYGPVFGGLFLAFPAIFPASATLVEKHEREKKQRAGIMHTIRGRQSAALDARGAAIGSLGLIVFAIVVWRFLERWNAPLTLLVALLVWLSVSILNLAAAAASCIRTAGADSPPGAGTRTSSRLAVSCFHAFFNAAPGLGRPLYLEHVKFLAEMSVVIYKKFLKFLNKFLAKVADMPDTGISMIFLLDGDNTVVALLLLLFALLAFNNADRAALHEAPGIGWLVHQHQNVHRIAVIG